MAPLPATRTALPPAVSSTPTNGVISSPRSPAPSILRPSKPTATDGAAAGQKRRITDMNISPPSSPSWVPAATEVDRQCATGPRKRTRLVQFDSEIETRPPSPALTDGAELEKSAAVIREEIRRAIERHVSGTDSDAYDRVKEIFTIGPKPLEDDGSMPENVPTQTALKHYLMGLLSNVASLDRSCEGLVHSILHSEWLGRDESYVRLFVRFIANLAAAQGGYLRSILKMLVSYLGEG
jgi:RNA polymerase I-specific transcription initiation factor RRN3